MTGSRYAGFGMGALIALFVAVALNAIATMPEMLLSSGMVTTLVTLVVLTACVLAQSAQLALDTRQTPVQFADTSRLARSCPTDMDTSFNSYL